jgi:carboxypeptidase Q
VYPGPARAAAGGCQDLARIGAAMHLARLARLLPLLLPWGCAPRGGAPAPAAVDAPETAVDPLLAALHAGEGDQSFALLAELCDDVGHRLAGSPGLAAAVDWAAARLAAAGHPTWTEAVMVPVWVRGEARLQLLAPVARELGVLALGGSVGTLDRPGGAVEAPLVVFPSLDAIDARARDHLVLVDQPMSDALPAIEQYARAVRPRGYGASVAASFGAVGYLVRSVTARSLYTPHTGALRYDPDWPAIPAAAVTTEDAGWLHRLQARGVPLRARLVLGAHTLPDAPSHNVLAEVRGARLPDEIVLIGAHLDSWDLGQGAHDDGAGVVEVMEALRRIRALPRPPARTVRAVLFTNEENGLRGGLDYRDRHGGERHVAAIESDLGGGRPLGFSATGSPEQMAWLQASGAPLGLPITAGGGGADIGPLGEVGVLRIGLRPDDSHYFDVHHTWADTLDKVDPVALSEASGALAGLAWLLAEAPGAPPQVVPAE